MAVTTDRVGALNNDRTAQVQKLMTQCLDDVMSDKSGLPRGRSSVERMQPPNAPPIDIGLFRFDGSTKVRDATLSLVSKIANWTQDPDAERLAAAVLKASQQTPSQQTPASPQKASSMQNVDVALLEVLGRANARIRSPNGKETSDFKLDDKPKADSLLAISDPAAAEFKELLGALKPRLQQAILAQAAAIPVAGKNKLTGCDPTVGRTLPIDE